MRMADRSSAIRGSEAGETSGLWSLPPAEVLAVWVTPTLLCIVPGPDHRAAKANKPDADPALPELVQQWEKWSPDKYTDKCRMTVVQSDRAL